jgi:hypothetical protein
MSKLKNKFWDKVYKCQHEPTENYLENFSCSTTYCDGMEWRCKHCGVYISECGCGSNNGMSGWSMKRWRKNSNG